MNRPGLELVHDRDDLPAERLAAEYWRAVSSLRGSDDAPAPLIAASRFPHDLARTCRHDRLRRVAVGPLTSFGPHDHVSSNNSSGPEAA
jgi:hypothetical protein